MLAQEQSWETLGWDVAVWHALPTPSSTLAELEALLQVSLPSKPTHSMNWLTCSAGSWKSPSNSSRAHCRGEMGVQHWNLPLTPPSPGGEGGSGRASSSTQASSRKQLWPYPARG